MGEPSRVSGRLRMEMWTQPAPYGARLADQSTFLFSCGRAHKKRNFRRVIAWFRDLLRAYFSPRSWHLYNEASEHYVRHSPSGAKGFPIRTLHPTLAFRVPTTNHAGIPRAEGVQLDYHSRCRGSVGVYS